VDFLVKWRLRGNTRQLASLRAELAVLGEQGEQLSQEAEEQRIRALVADSKTEGMVAKDSARHAEAFARRRSDIIAAIARKESQQDALLDQLSGRKK
jgi:hypothetical protein